MDADKARLVMDDFDYNEWDSRALGADEKYARVVKIDEVTNNRIDEALDLVKFDIRVNKDVISEINRIAIQDKQMNPNGLIRHILTEYVQNYNGAVRP